MARLQTLKPRLTATAARLEGTSAVKRITGTTLQNIRAKHFRLKPLCVMCEAVGRTELATELDHIVPLYKGGADQDHNRQGLCYACHKVKTAQDMKPG